jgi:hypothetical protein
VRWPILVALAALVLTPFADARRPQTTPSERKPWFCDLAPEPKKLFDDDDCLDDQCRKRRRPRPQWRAPVDPNALNKSEVVMSINRIKRNVQCCYEAFRVPGLAMVRIVIEPSGRLASADVKYGVFAGTPTGACVESAVMLAKFPRKKQPATLDYPFQLPLRIGP